MAKIESTKGASYEKFLVVSCNGEEVLDSARTLAEATTILADLANDDACFVMKILRTTSDADPVRVFDVDSRPPRYVEQAAGEPPIVGTERVVETVDEEVVVERPPERKPQKQKEVEEEVSISETMADLGEPDEAPPLEI